MSPSAPRTEEGLYWGYSVRLAPSFGAVFTQSPYKEGYDITIGTSERGTSVDDLELPNFRYSTKNLTNNFQILNFDYPKYVMLPVICGPFNNNKLLFIRCYYFRYMDDL